MNYFKKYREYLKDNKEGYWFKRKVFGWGWTPAKWQGWFVLLAFVAFILLSSFDLTSNLEPTDKDVTLFIIKTILSAFLLILICYKTGEKPKWQWGFPKENSKENLN